VGKRLLDKKLWMDGDITKADIVSPSDEFANKACGVDLRFEAEDGDDLTFDVVMRSKKMPRKWYEQEEFPQGWPPKRIRIIIEEIDDE